MAPGVESRLWEIGDIVWAGEEWEERGFMAKRKASVIVFLFVMMLGLFPFLNSLSNPRLAAAHGTDFMQLMAAGLCFGFGFGLLVGAHKFSGV